MDFPEIVGGIFAASGLWWYFSNKEFELASQKLEYLENTFEDTVFDESVGLNPEQNFSDYKRLSESEPSKYLAFLDPVKYFFLKKNFSDLRDRSIKILENLKPA